MVYPLVKLRKHNLAIASGLARDIQNCQRCCRGHQAIDLMDDWFDTQDSGTREVVVLLVTECVEEVQTAGQELVALTGE